MKEITLLGHSLGDVDFPYFKAIVENVRNVDDLIWNFSYYSEDFADI
ncbi:bacteriophage abortive infection AbiH family protein [Bacteroides thetaiotaomicron]|nr:bacteriophage abortive infection AbiH family protein [Bacteroides thetaiotaomicron]